MHNWTLKKYCHVKSVSGIICQEDGGRITFRMCYLLQRQYDISQNHSPFEVENFSFPSRSTIWFLFIHHNDDPTIELCQLNTLLACSRTMIPLAGLTQLVLYFHYRLVQNSISRIYSPGFILRSSWILSFSVTVGSVGHLSSLFSSLNLQYCSAGALHNSKLNWTATETHWLNEL